MRLYLVRHTRVAVPPGICYGQSDVALADTFRQECEKIKSRLQKIDFEYTFSSTLSRCKILANELSDNVIEDMRLQELNFGDWENTSWNAIFDTEEGKEWFADYLNQRCPNGESYNDMLNRVRQFIADLPNTDGNVLIITHAGVIRAFRIILENWSVKKAFDKPVAYGQVTILEKKSK